MSTTEHCETPFSKGLHLLVAKVQTLQGQLKWIQAFLFSMCNQIG